MVILKLKKKKSCFPYLKKFEAVGVYNYTYVSIFSQKSYTEVHDVQTQTKNKCTVLIITNSEHIFWDTE